MPVFKLDLIFEAKGRGWRETYYKNFSSDSVGATLTLAQKLASLRIQLSAPPVVIKAYTIQDPITEGRQGQAIYFNPPAVALERSGSEGSVAPSACINVAFLHNTGNLTREIQMRGVWDGAVTNFNDLNSEVYDLWFQKFLKLRTFLLAEGFGWMNTPRAGSAQVSYSYPVGSEVPTFTTTAAFWPEGQLNTFQRARFSRFNKSRSPLNRELVVFVTSTTTAEAALAISAGPMENKGRVLRYGDPVFVTADNIGVTRVGRRSPGAPLLYTPGRRSNRARS